MNTKIFRSGDRVFWSSFDKRHEFGRKGVARWAEPAATCVDWDNGEHSCSLDVKDLSHAETVVTNAEPRRITSADQIRTGATYDVAGAKLIGQAEDELRWPTLQDVDGKPILVGGDRCQLEWLLAAGAVITEVAPPPEPAYVEPEWQPGDWAISNGRRYLYAPAHDGDNFPWFSGAADHWISRDAIDGPLSLYYRHGQAS